MIAYELNIHLQKAIKRKIIAHYNFKGLLLFTAQEERQGKFIHE